uniref:IZUMO family member 2 n=1 Tax=Suricata suricatta TaxID=37032 RepID=A0A673V250_SURSU
MPLALALLLLLLGLRAPGARGCLQCDPSVQEALSQLRLALVPKRFLQEQLRVRARALLLGMEGPFFRDYALNAFVGKVGIDHLKHVVSFIKNQTGHLMVNSLRDEPLLEELVAVRERVLKELKKGLKLYKVKDLMKEVVLDCLHCQKISPSCIKRKYCFADRQPRMNLQYEKGHGYQQNPAVFGGTVSVFLAVLAFGVIVASAVTYRQNRKLLLQ